MVDKPNFNKKVPSGSTLILTSPVFNPESELYEECVKALANSEFQKVIWICYQKTPKDVIEKLTQIGADTQSIEKLFFIDLLSNMLGLDQKSPNTYYCKSPTEYNCLLRSIEQLSEKEEGVLIIFDNLNALMSYDIIDRMIRFVRNLNRIVSSINKKIIYLYIAGGSSQEIEISIEATMDNIHYLQDIPALPVTQNPWNQFHSISWSDVFSLSAPLMFILLMIMIVVNFILLGTLIFIVLYG